MEFILGLISGLVASSMFYVILGFAVTALLLFAHNDHLFGATVLVGVIGVVAWFKWPNVYSFVVDNILLTIALYVVFGVLTSLLKWTLFNRTRSNEIKTYRDQFLKKHDLPVGYLSLINRNAADSVTLLTFIEYLRERFYFKGTALTIEDAIEKVIPKADDNKKSLFAWTIYWPLYLVLFIVSDFIATVAEEIYERFGSVYQKIANRLFQNIT